MTPRVSYPSKVMLVGEYGVVVGGAGLTIPFRRFHARVRSMEDIPEDKQEEAFQSIRFLKDLFNHIRDKGEGAFHAAPDLEIFSSRLEDQWLEMNIPLGYGLGSSGAVSAAIYDLFFAKSREVSLEQQKEDLAAIESYFHGKSSGVDALTCHADQALHFEGNGAIRRVEFDPLGIPGGYRFFLLDSGERFDTGPLVEHFLKKMEDPGFASSIRTEYLVMNQKLIESLLGMRDADPAMLVRVLSDFQFTHFRKMIPSQVADLWIEGQVSNEFYLKLNGSGGGFMLGIAHHSSMESLSERWKTKLIWIE
jgi:mevalonate kinase